MMTGNKKVDCIISFISKADSNINNLTTQELKELKPFLQALLTKQVFAYDEWVPTKTEEGFKPFVLIDFSYGGVLLCKGSLNWKSGDCPYSPHMFYWTDYGTKWAFTEEELVGKEATKND